MTAVLLVPDSHAHPAALGVLAEPVCRAGGGIGADSTAVVSTVMVARTDTGAPVVDRHLRVGVSAPRPWRLAADVLMAPGGASQATSLACRHPGALVVAAVRDRECWVRVRVGTSGGVLLRIREQAAAPRAGSPPRLPPWPVWASLVHAWLVAGLPAQALASSSAHLVRAGSPPGTAVRERTVLLRAEP